jgi:phosphoribosylaminoimidazolecarboxamide formyltransferase/IMP cyclohydrolase
VVNPQKYDLILNTLKEHDNSIPLNLRAEFAAEVFEHTAYYDSLIAGYFNKYLGIEYPEKLNLAFNLDMKLRYGENPHQSAALYGSFTQIFKHIHGKELSYNNVVDIDAAAKLILEFEPLTAVIVKHTNPCGVGTGKTLSEAYQKAYTTDTASAFGGIMTFNAIIDEETARAIHDLFTEVIVAPAFTVEALAVLQKKRDRRLIQADYDLLKKNIKTDFRSVTSGCLVQNTDRVLIQDSGLKVVTKRQPTESEITALNFAWRIAKHVKSNAIIFTSAERTLGVGAGQMSRVDSARIAAEKANMMGLDLKGSVVASDAYFPFPDGVEHAAKAGATAIIQPGGSVRDNLVIEAADRLNLAMVFTGIRHFRH